MKHTYLKASFTIIASFMICALKAQSVQQKFQKDMEARKKNVSTVRLKAMEQQAQQKAERTSQMSTQQEISSVPSNNQSIPAQQKMNEIKAQRRTDITKLVTTQQAPAKTAQ